MLAFVRYIDFEEHCPVMAYVNILIYVLLCSMSFIALMKKE